MISSSSNYQSFYDCQLEFLEDSLVEILMIATSHSLVLLTFGQGPGAGAGAGAATGAAHGHARTTADTTRCVISRFEFSFATPPDRPPRAIAVAAACPFRAAAEESRV